MENRNLKLVKNRKQKKYNKAIFFLCLIAVLGIGIYFLITDFSIQNIEVKGNTTYTDAEIINAVKSQDYVDNTLVMIAQNQVFGQTYLPFIENISMGYDKSHTLKIKVKEKLRAGVFEYMNKNVYFNSEGIALESRNQLFDGVPVVTGVSFNKMVLGKKIPVDGDYFDTIMNITKKISTYGLEISEIHFENEDDITLVSGKYQIYLGSSLYLDGKMSKIAGILSAVSKEHKKGVIDMHLYTDEKNIITYHK
ncbi:MAG: FtsQ-type POTRA domain-containing protein [Lachnospiraceae bacterium]|nr:FtsQ-type POTRA domain-containing protein [Lachnospiraceae bacterium]